MGAGRQTETHTLGDRIPRSYGVSSSVPARNLGKKQLGGVIFGCTNYTMKECISNLVFGLPATHFSYIKNIEPGLPLFLFNYSDRKLHGIYEAAGHGKMNINPYGWTTNGSDQTEYPAQVRVRVRKQCEALSEEQYKKVLQKNYAENQRHFRFELDHAQTGQLLSLFESSPSTNSFATFSYNSPARRPYTGAVLSLDAHDEAEDLKMSVTEEACSEHLNTESDVPADSPHPARKWISLFKENSVSDGRSESDDKPFASEGDWDEENLICSNGSNIDSGLSGVPSGWDEETPPSDVFPSWVKETRPSVIISCWDEEKERSGVTPCWEEEKEHSGVTPCWEEEAGPSSITPCWEDEEQIIRTQGEKEAIEDDDEEHVFCKLKQLAFDCEYSKSKEHTENVFVPLGPKDSHWEEESSPVALPTDKENSNSAAAGMEDAFYPCGMGSLDLDGHSFSTLSTSEKGNSEEDAKDDFVPCGTDNSHLEDGQFPGPSKPEKLENVVNSLDIQSVIVQLRQELKAVKEFSLDQQRKASTLEKKLADSGVLLQHLRHRVMSLETQLQDPSTVGVEVCNNSCSNEVLIDSFDKPHLGVNEVMFIMGGYDGLSWLPTVECYSPSRDIVNSLKPMNTLRSYASATVLNGLIYNFGGWNVHSKLWYDTVECYNPYSDEWISCRPLSKRKGCLAGASVNNRIYAVGGGNGIDCFKEVEMFDPALERWIPTQSMLHKRFASASAVLDGVLYVVGGYDGKNYLKSAERFDPREASWSKLQNMDTSRGSHALTVFKGKLYALGGYNGNNYVPSVEIFDPCMGSWMAADDAMKHSRGYFAAAVLGETIYAIGGQSEGGNIVDSVETYRLGHGWSETKMKGIGKRCFFSCVLY